MVNIKLDPENRFDKIYFCFKKCITSFKEKPLSPYEKECIFPCLENQININLELHNTKLSYEQLSDRERSN